MSRKRYTPEDFEFARQFGEKLDEAIEGCDLTREEAASLLRIHRSMLFRYLGGKSIPGSKVLQRACEELGVAVDYRGIRVNADYFKGETRVDEEQPTPTQTEIAFTGESFASPLARVDIRKKKHARSETLELKMTIRLRK